MLLSGLVLTFVTISPSFNDINTSNKVIENGGNKVVKTYMLRCRLSTPFIGWQSVYDAKPINALS